MVEDIYGSMRTKSEKRHLSLVMELYFTNKGKVKVSTIKYTKRVIGSSMEKISGHTSRTESAHLLNVYKE